MTSPSKSVMMVGELIVRWRARTMTDAAWAAVVASAEPITGWYIDVWDWSGYAAVKRDAPAEVRA